ncbi:PepSY domain-containing protein [Pseudochelatococcus sp. B33]
MKTTFMTLAAISFASAAAFAQEPPPRAPGPESDPPTIITPGTPDRAAPVPGENSFTEEQARERIVEAGYTDVGPLSLDPNGVWRGTAAKNGLTVNVGVDYEGNVVEQ